ncbi:MAG TPA: MBL fold hydrolase, partial [Alphaproteobacteria bacterium]|nr:MBL fold hydrolase [Alphaproteobacteria bacterium]
CGVKQVCLIKDGDVLRLAPEPAEVVGEVKTGVMAIDGKKIIPVNSGVLRQRRRMIEDGSVVATVVLDKNGTVLGQAQFSAVGLMEQDSPEFAQMDEAIKAAMEKMPPEARLDDKTVVDTVKSCVRKVVMESCGRRPMVDVHLVRV